jgi:hypothetical protein
MVPKIATLIGRDIELFGHHNPFTRRTVTMALGAKDTVIVMDNEFSCSLSILHLIDDLYILCGADHGARAAADAFILLKTRHAAEPFGHMHFLERETAGIPPPQKRAYRPQQFSTLRKLHSSPS